MSASGGHISEMSPTALALATSDTNQVVSTGGDWVFTDTPQDLSQQLRRHRRGQVFNNVAIRTVVPFTLENAASVFAAMAEDVNEEARTMRVREDVLCMSDKSVSIRISKDMIDPEVEISRNPWAERRPGRLVHWNPFKSVSFVPSDAKFATITAIMIKYRPLVNIYHQAGRMEISLWDHGLAQAKPVSLTSSSKTAPANILLGLNHSVYVQQLNRLELRIEVSSTGMNPGHPWGTAEIAFRFCFSQKPLLKAYTQSVIQYELPSDLFIVRQTDPSVFNAELSQNDIDTLRCMQMDIPVLKENQLSNIGTLVKKGTANGPDYPPDERLKPSRPETWVAENPFRDPSVSSPSVSVPRSVGSLADFMARPNTRALEEIRSMTAQCEAMMATVREHRISPQTSGDPQLVSGLPAVLRFCSGLEVADEVVLTEQVPTAVRQVLTNTVLGDNSVFIGPHANVHTTRICTYAFSNSVEVSVRSLFMNEERIQYSAI